MLNHNGIKGPVCLFLLAFTTITFAQEGSPSGGKTPRSGTSYKESKREGRGSQFPKEAVDALTGFQTALKNEDYATAMAFCSESVRNASGPYHSEEAFIKDVVPVETIVKLPSITMYSATRSYKNREPEIVAISCGVKYDELRWDLDLKKTQYRWEIDFMPRPVKEWAGTVRDYYKRKKAVNKERVDALEKHISSLRTRLSAHKLTVKVGEPIMVGLVLHNDSPADLVYDASQVGVNNSLTVLDSKGNAIPYSADLVQTVIDHVDIKAGSKAVLLENFDVTRQYAISKPGEYRIRFNGSGLMIGRRFVYEQFETDYSEKVLGRPKRRKSEVGYSLAEFPSNTVTVTVER